METFWAISVEIVVIITEILISDELMSIIMACGFGVVF